MGGIEMNDMNHIESIIDKIYVEKIQVKQLIFEYRGVKDICLHRCVGESDVVLSPAYFKRIETQFNSLEQHLLKFFSTLTSEVVIVKIPVKSSGDFDIESLQIEITTTLKNHKPFVNKIARLNRTCMRYAELLHEVRIHGNQSELSHLTAFLVTSLDELLYSAEQPVVQPKLKEDWAQVLRKAQSEARRTFNYERVLPCIDGLLEWDTAEICLQIHQLRYLSKKGGIAK